MTELPKNNRQPELDIAKAFAIMFMVWVHLFEELTPTPDSLWYIFVEVLGGPFAAPIFMVCLGIGIDYSRHNRPNDLFRRGLHLLGVGFALNIVRFGLPDLLKFIITGDTAWLRSMSALFSVDILQFAGLAFLFLAFLKKLELSKWKMLLTGGCCSVAGTLLNGMSNGYDAVDYVLGFFMGTGAESYFPFLNWIIFPIFGMVFGRVLQETADKPLLYLKLNPICTMLMLGYLAMTVQFGLMFLTDGSYYRLSCLDALFFCILSMLVFCWCYGLLHLLPEKVKGCFYRWSKNINTIYCIHWAILGFLKMAKQLLWPEQVLPFWLGTVIAASLLVVSDRLAVAYKARRKG